MHERKRRKGYVKRAELFFFSRRVYHLIVGSSLLETFYLDLIMKFTCKTRVFQAEELVFIALTVPSAKIGSLKLCQ